MGDFNYACALTHTAIREGDPVFFSEIVEKEEDPKLTKLLGPKTERRISTYDVRSAIYRGIRMKVNPNWNEIDKSSTYPSSVDLDPLELNIKTRSFFGEYDGYGSTKKRESPDVPKQCFMVHASVARKVAELQHAPTMIGIDVLFALTCFSVSIREELYAISLPIPGFQYVDKEEIRSHRILMNMKEVILLDQEEDLMEMN
jgi:hypothetical protein